MTQLGEKYNILIECVISMKVIVLIKMCLHETYSKYLSDAFLIKNGMKQRNVLLPFMFEFPLEHAIIKVQENQEVLELNLLDYLLIYADDVNLLSKNINTIMRNT
jgi:hypothetical protein